MREQTRMEKLKEARKRKGYTQEELAHAVNVGAMTIYQYESGRRVPNARMLKQIAQALDCKVDDIL